MPELSDLDSLLDGDSGEFSTINPKIVHNGAHIAEVFLNAGFDSWGTFINKGILLQMTNCRHALPSDALSSDDGKFVVITISWSGDRDGFFHVLVDENGAKGAIAYFMALAMGTEADIENTQLDEESMDAFGELVNTLTQQGAQALRGDGAVGGTVDLKVEKTNVIDFSQTTAEVEFGTDELICQSGQLTIEGLAPVPVWMLMSVSCTGMSAEIAQTESQKGAGDIGDTLKHLAKPQNRHRNERLALKLPIPVVVVLATTKSRVENIKELAPGSIIEFKKFAGEFLDVCAGNTKFAEGEVVIVNQHFGIQLRKITPKIPPARLLR